MARCTALSPNWSARSARGCPRCRCKDRARRYGRSKYNLTRVPRVLLDLITIAFLSDYRTRPMQLFGLFGLSSSGLGALIGLVLVVRKIVAGILGGADAFRAFRIGTSPWLLLAILLIVVGVQFFLMGLLGEMITRTYHESQGKEIYAIREIVQGDKTEADRA